LRNSEVGSCELTADEARGAAINRQHPPSRSGASTRHPRPTEAQVADPAIRRRAAAPRAPGTQRCARGARRACRAAGAGPRRSAGWGGRVPRGGGRWCRRCHVDFDQLAAHLDAEAQAIPIRGKPRSKRTSSSLSRRPPKPATSATTCRRTRRCGCRRRYCRGGPACRPCTRVRSQVRPRHGGGASTA
jgi:hypothetical protein